MLGSRSPFGARPVATAMVLAITLLSGPSCAERTTPSRSMLVEALGQAQGERRPCLGRLAGGFHYAPPPVPPPAPTRGAAGPAPGAIVLGPGFARAAALALSAAADRSGPAEHCAAGIVHLFRGDMDRAIAALESAREAAPADSGIAADCAAAYLERARTYGTSRDVARALARADQALRLTPDLPEAMFNRALALEALSLVAAAEQQWRDYMSVEADPGWKAEADERLARFLDQSAELRWTTAKPELEDAALEGRMDRVTELARATSAAAVLKLARDELPATWARAELDGDAELADRALRTARPISEAVFAQTGDASARDVLREIDSTSGAGRQTLAVAITALAEGRHSYARRSLETARERFSVALARAGSQSALAPFARFERARCDVFGLRYSDALEAVAETGELAEGASYHDLAARCRWVEGTIRLLQSETVGAAELLRSALATFESFGDVDAVSDVTGLLSSVADVLGDSDAVWSYQLASLAASEMAGYPDSYALGTAAFSLQAVHEGELELAIYFADAALTTPGAADPTTRAIALCNRAVACARAGRPAEASAGVESARATVAGIDDPAMRARAEIELTIAEAEVLSGANPTLAAERLGGVLEQMDAAGDTARRAHILGLRGAVWEAAGNIARAREDYVAVAAEIEAQRRALPGDALRIAFATRQEPIFDRAAAFELLHGDGAAAALWFTETNRARTLSDVIGPRDDAVGAWLDRRGTLDHALAGLGDAAIVEYGFHGDLSVVWVCTSNGVSAVTLPTPGPAIEREALAFEAAVASGAQRDELAAAGESLFETLLAPVLPLVAGRSPVVVVPDGVLQGFPFAALMNPATGRYAIEEMELAVSPSLAVYLRTVAREAVRELASAGADSALVVGNPSFSRERFRGLADIHDAELEARQVAMLYSDAELLTGPAARREAFLRRAPSARVVHFAGHAVLGDVLAGGPVLVFAEEAGGEAADALGVRDVSSLDLDRTRVVFLAACGTGGRATFGEGLSGLVRAFLASGATTVIGSLWAADDRATAPLAVEFHRHLRAGEPPVTALALAQRSMLASPEPERRTPRHWAVFTLFGGAMSKDR